MGAYTAFLDVVLGFGSPALGLIAGWAGLNAIFLASAVLVFGSSIIALRLLYAPSATNHHCALASHRACELCRPQASPKDIRHDDMDE
jgi:hypothetical protein